MTLADVYTKPYIIPVYITVYNNIAHYHVIMYHPSTSSLFVPHLQTLTLNFLQFVTIQQ